MNNLKLNAQECLKEISNFYKGDDDFVKVFFAGILSKSNILLQSSHGKGKSLLAELASKVCSVSYKRIQGTPGLTESKFIARFNVADLIKGTEKIDWMDFSKARIKLFDEINRCPAPTLSALFSMLAEKSLNFGNDFFKLDDFVFIATMNPSDEGTFEIPNPLMDRFDLCMLVPTPSVIVKSEIIDMQNSGQPKKIIGENNLIQMWKEVDDVKVSKSIKTFVSSVIRDLQLCVHGDKEYLSNFPQICQECRFKNYVCSKLDARSPVSERSYISLLKVSKAYAYLNDSDEVTMQDIKKILPYVILHRVRFTSSFEKQSITKQKGVNEIIEQIFQKDVERAGAYKLIERIIKNDTKEKTSDLMNKLDGYAKNDNLINEVYVQLQKEIVDNNVDDGLDKNNLSIAQLKELYVANSSRRLEIMGTVFKKIEYKHQLDSSPNTNLTMLNRNITGFIERDISEDLAESFRTNLTSDKDFMVTDEKLKLALYHYGTSLFIKFNCDFVYVDQNVEEFFDTASNVHMFNENLKQLLNAGE